MGFGWAIPAVTVSFPELCEVLKAWDVATGPQQGSVRELKRAGSEAVSI